MSSLRCPLERIQLVLEEVNMKVGVEAEGEEHEEPDGEVLEEGGHQFPLPLSLLLPTPRRIQLQDWVDENNNKIVCELFADGGRIGNRSSTTLNRAGYKNVIKRFKERTGLLYTHRQFKNKWDRLKDIKGAIRFKEKGLEHEDHLDAIFQDLHNTGDDHWCASSGVAPSQGGEEEGHEEEEDDDSDDSDPEVVTPTSSREKKSGNNNHKQQGKTT
ncbi:hypothetical protein PR202_gb12844 [Eleusine coracana subsp. coracana]|uniref:Myb/SANT-like domain-containing protein n=1 Tax=Eleusine coracana subsp. coracana TaxID=191504 RepID=A0AAV5ES36_ELECO|nr:hypothetical protein PR202_gb12844 [Eleusine coracana subsp. coracana]